MENIIRVGWSKRFVVRVLVKILILFTAFVLCQTVVAHPTGNMVVVDKTVLWSYINPIEDNAHHACVMIWSEGEKPRPFITSKFTASDFMIYAIGETIYLIERRHLQASDTFEVRLLKTDLNGESKVIWPWFEDKWRIGEGGFFMLSDTKMVFCKYPDLLVLNKGETPRPYFNFDFKIKRIRFLEDEKMLLLSDDVCRLADQQGNILKEWENLTETTNEEPPLGRNQVFDVDYYNDELLVAYWGQRSFYSIDAAGNRKRIEQLKEPFAPHWVAFFGKKKLLFASKIVFDGSAPKPKLIFQEGNGQSRDIWVYE